MKIISVVGARPNFMKVSALHRVFKHIQSIDSVIVHTGQHYDEKMSAVFFDELELPKPDYFLGIGSGSHAQVTAKVMMAFEQVVLDEKPDIVLVVGDINSTLACALVASKLNIKLVHVEAGLRSGDRQMPEEINRIITDSISDELFVTERSGIENLKHEGVADDKVHFVGNVMIDSLVHYYDKITDDSSLSQFNLKKNEYVVMTMHRPSNVDNHDALISIIEVIEAVVNLYTVVFPMHPRTRQMLQNFDLLKRFESINNLIVLPPLGYIQFLSLVNYSAMVLTDSGGIQEETTYLKKPCLTLRDSTERPCTIEEGSNILIPEIKVEPILQQIKMQGEKTFSELKTPQFWDGNSAKRISAILLRKYQS